MDQTLPEYGPPRRDTLVFPVSGVGAATGIRLPPETRFWQWVSGLGGQLQFRYGNTVVPSEVLGAGTLSPMHVYPGDGCYIEFTAPAGSIIMVHWTW